MELSPRSMASLWLSGLERRPEESGEICVFEIFGESLEEGRAAVGQGIKPFLDPSLTWEFEAPALAIDIREPHVYAAEWRSGRVEFSVDGTTTKTVEQAPAYPVQAMVAVFDFPEKAPALEHVPELAVDWIRGSG
jgi:hypothetical protein